MRIIITKEQHRLISEAMGIPDAIYDASEVFFDLFANHLKSISEKEDTYEFDGNVNIKLGGKSKIEIDRYRLLVQTFPHEQFDETAKIVSFGMGQSFAFDKTIMKKRINTSTEAIFMIKFVVSENWEPNELYDEYIRDRVDILSSLSHELKHKYDQEMKQIGLIGAEADYSSLNVMPNFQIPVLDDEFKFYLYFTSAVENLVRTTEVGSNIKNRGIKKSEFREFLQNNRTFKTLVDIKNFTYEKLIEGIRSDMEQVDEIMRVVDEDPNQMTENEKIGKVLEIFYEQLNRAKTATFDRMMSKPLNLFAELVRSLGAELGVDINAETEEDKIRVNYVKHIKRYEKNPTEFYQNEIELFHKVSNDMIRKIAKLYELAKDN
jgi:hypothetical protein